MNALKKLFNSSTAGNLGASPDMWTIKNPLVIVFEGDDGEVTTHIYPEKYMSHGHYGLLICDLVRHVARAFKVSEDDVWGWVDRERQAPTTEINGFHGHQ